MFPKKIFQTSPKKEIPEECIAFVDSWKFFNPDYEYVHFDDRECEEYVKKYFPHYYDKFIVSFEKTPSFRWGMNRKQYHRKLSKK